MAAKRVCAPGLLAVLWLLASLASAAEPAAVVKAVEGKAYAIAAGETRTLALEDGVHAGERLITAADSGVTLLFADRTRVELGENAIFRIDSYSYSRNPEADVAQIGVLKGAFRYVSGLIARRRPSAVQVGMTVGTIGIRGTHVVGEVTETSARVALMDAYYTTLREDPFLDQEELAALVADDTVGAIEVANDYGRVIIDQAGYGTEIPDATSPPSPPRRIDVSPVTRQLRTIQTIRRVIPPRMPSRLP